VAAIIVRRVLVVEDNPVNAFVALKQLTALGFAGSAVASGSEAVNAIKAQTFDVILMDCGLPDMDGFQTARIIRDFEQRSQGGRRIPIIAVTIENDNDTLDKCISAGMDAYLPKPTSITELRDTLERLST
jgi:CheY-like chemotaxis protein